MKTGKANGQFDNKPKTVRTVKRDVTAQTGSSFPVLNVDRKKKSTGREIKSCNRHVNER